MTTRWATILAVISLAAPAARAGEPPLGAEDNEVHTGADDFRLRGMGWHAYASPVRDGERIYYHWENGVFSAIEAATGKWVFSEIIETATRRRAAGAVYPSLTMAGEYVFATGGGGISLAVRPGGSGGEPAFAGQGVVPGDIGGNALVFHGRQVFIHAGEELFCISEKQPAQQGSSVKGLTMEAK